MVRTRSEESCNQLYLQASLRTIESTIEERKEEKKWTTYWQFSFLFADCLFVYCMYVRVYHRTYKRYTIESSIEERKERKKWTSLLSSSLPTSPYLAQNTSYPPTRHRGRQRDCQVAYVGYVGTLEAYPRQPLQICVVHTYDTSYPPTTRHTHRGRQRDCQVAYVGYVGTLEAYPSLQRQSLDYSYITGYVSRSTYVGILTQTRAPCLAGGQALSTYPSLLELAQMTSHVV